MIGSSAGGECLSVQRQMSKQENQVAQENCRARADMAYLCLKRYAVSRQDLTRSSERKHALILRHLEKEALGGSSPACVYFA